jgi:hypothetical protein
VEFHLSLKWRKRRIKMKIKNRSANLVVYSIDDLKVYRRFAPGEVKDVTMEEI